MRIWLLPLVALLAACSTFQRDERLERTGFSVDSTRADSLFGDSLAARAGELAPQAAAAPLLTRVLDNGLRVIVVPNPAVPLVTVEIDVKNGAYTQAPPYEGLAHLYEHMFFKANEKLPSQERWLERTRELGVVWNGTTSQERVNYFITLQAQDLQAGLEFMRDAIRYPLFDQAELERERPVVLGEYDRNEADPMFHLNMATDSLLWTPGYFSRKNTIGNRDVIAATTREQMLEIQRLYYVPNNASLILAGDLETEEGFHLAQEVFGDWPRGQDPFSTRPIPPPPALQESRAVIVERPVNTVTLTLNWQGPSVSRNAAATYAADLFTALLRLPDSGFQKRIVDSGLAFSAGIAYTSLSHVGPIRLTAQTTPDKVLLLKQALDREIASFDDPGYFTDAQLAAAKNLVRVADVYAREQPSAFAHMVGYWWAVADLQYYLNYVANVREVDRPDIAEYVRTYIQGRPRVVGLLITAEDRAKAGLTVAELR
ncbi:MAG TPA: pitrilysin family protein [Gemmatimonadota bacterium]|jgi:zinc protease